MATSLVNFLIRGQDTVDLDRFRQNIKTCKPQKFAINTLTYLFSGNLTLKNLAREM